MEKKEKKKKKNIASFFDIAVKGPIKLVNFISVRCMYSLSI